MQHTDRIELIKQAWLHLQDKIAYEEQEDLMWVDHDMGVIWITDIEEAE